MTLQPGARVGAYDIVELIGAGGMGEVYRARDTRLDRDVAIKILPGLFSADPDRLARFEREAKTLASLNHPNIAQIYGIEPLPATADAPQTAGSRALVMELVEGEDLSARIARGPMPLDEALAIARQIADALEAAHERGVIHRDLKPANVKVRDDGTVKVLDFGLAKALDPVAGTNADPMNSPTITSPATQMGMILGTAAYMAPEQAKGRPVDKRADIWAFGAVLYEMLTGRRAFHGEDVSETLAAVLRAEPDMTALGGDVAGSVRRLIDRCLRKDPRARLRDIGDARHALEDPYLDETSERPPSRAARVRTALPWAIAAAALIALAMVWSAERSAVGSPASVRRFAIDLPWHSAPNWTDVDIALSPAGQHVAYYGRRPNENDVSVYVRALDSLDGVALADARQAVAMVFSADGEWIALLDPHGIRKISIHGGRPQQIARIDGGGFGLSWGTDGGLLVGHASGLLRIPPAGGEASPFTRIDTAAGEIAHVDPHLLPNGTHALMAIAAGNEFELAAVDLARGTYARLGISGTGPSYLRSGHLVFRQGRTIAAAGFDLKTMRVTSQPVPVLENVRRGPYLAADGTMAYVPERTESTASLVWVDRAGRSTAIPGERLDYSHLALGGGGREALLDLSGDLFVRDILRGSRRLLSSGAWFPIWSPDARWATHAASTGGTSAIVRRPADGSGPPETLLTSSAGLVPTSWNSRTGELAYFDQASDIWILKPGGTPARLIASAHNERSGMFSPDGRWLAYVSDETGAYQVYVVPYPGPGRKIAVSIDGGMSPIWSADGKELFFRRGGRMMSASMTSPSTGAGTPVMLFDGPFTMDFMGHQRYDVAHDGRFLMVEDAGDFRFIVVQAWTEEVRKLVARGAGG